MATHPRCHRRTQTTRTVNRWGYVSIQRFYVYAERGLARKRVAVWIYEGQALAHIRRFDEADRLFDQAAVIYRARFGANHVRTADAIRNQALADFQAGRLPRAEQRIEQVLAIYNKVFDGNHPTQGSALILEGRIQTARRDWTGAARSFGKARALFTQLYGATNSTVGDVNFYAAEALSQSGDTQGALQLTAIIKTIYDASYGPDDPDQVELLMLRSRILTRAQRWDEARRDCAAGAALQARLDPKDPTLADTRKTCSEIHP